MTLMDMAFRLKVGLRRDGQSGAVIAYCPALNLYSAGENESEAHAAATSAVKLYLEACWERGKFEHAMRRANFMPAASPTALAKAKTAEFISIRESAYDSVVDVDVQLTLVGLGETSCLH